MLLLSIATSLAEAITCISVFILYAFVPVYQIGNCVSPIRDFVRLRNPVHGNCYVFTPAGMFQRLSDRLTNEVSDMVRLC